MERVGLAITTAEVKGASKPVVKTPKLQITTGLWVRVLKSFKIRERVAYGVSEETQKDKTPKEFKMLEIILADSTEAVKTITL